MASKVPPPSSLSSTSGNAGRQPKHRSLRKRAVATWQSLAIYPIRHRRWFFRGALFALLLVAVRVALPWPLQVLIQPWLESGHLRGSGLFGEHPALVVGIIYAALVALLGFADYRLRYNFARFSISVVRDIREGILDGIAQLRRRDRGRTSGDLVTRLVGDSARLKAGLKGFLVHVATNGLLFLGISVVLLCMEWRIGMIFFLASLLTVAITAYGASVIYRRALKYRRRETKIADSISDRMALIDAVTATGMEEEDEELEQESHGANRASGRHEAKITRIQGLTTWAAHLVLAIAVPAALWVGHRATGEGLISISELFVVMLYALMILGPMVRLTRQGARCGKIMASADRLRVLHDRAHRRTEESRELAPLEHAISLEAVKVRASDRKGRRLGPVTLQFSAGEKVAVLGPAGCGKSTLLSLLAGREDYKGEVTWDDLEYGDILADTIPGHVAIVDQIPQGPGVDLAELSADVQRCAAGDPLRKMLKLGGGRQLRDRIERGGQERLQLEELSYSERKVLGLLRVGKSAHALKLIDDPVCELRSNSVARKYLSAFLGTQGEKQTVVVALDRPVALKQFDRVLVLGKRGKVSFDGTVPEWQAWQAAGNRAASGTPDPARMVPGQSVGESENVKQGDDESMG